MIFIKLKCIYQLHKIPLVHYSFAADQGLEPQYPPPKGGVLPLDESAMCSIKIL